jgi:hypothetical protein
MTDLAVRRILDKRLFRLCILTQDICRTCFDTYAAADAAFDDIYNHDSLSLLSFVSSNFYFSLWMVGGLPSFHCASSLCFFSLMI